MTGRKDGPATPASREKWCDMDRRDGTARHLRNEKWSGGSERRSLERSVARVSTFTGTRQNTPRGRSSFKRKPLTKDCPNAGAILKSKNAEYADESSAGEIVRADLMISKRCPTALAVPKQAA